MSTPAVRFIVEVVSSKSDANGNRSHFARLTSTKTGKRLTVRDLGGPGNMSFLLCRLLGRSFNPNYPNVYSTETTLGVRNWRRAAGRHNGFYEHELTAEHVLALEQVDAP